jgi:tRNA modification GTPase
MHEMDTITALATPPGHGSIAVIRISGPETYQIADRLLRVRGPAPSERAPYTFAFGHISTGGVDLDECLMLFMRAPHSFTGEDVVEIQGHGGPVVSGRILRAVIEAGARPAEPGEFSRRAFLNGRIDLVQAEAVNDLIRSQSDRAAAAALEQLEGALSRRFNDLYDELLTVAADLEATLDFPDDELPPAVTVEIFRRLEAVREHLAGLIATWDEGHMLREGVSVVISGKPNTGKSTLLNALLGRERAIVSEVPGTTRDFIEEGLILDGIPLRIIDTAGLRVTDCGIEQEGIERTQKHLQASDVQIFIIDSSIGLDPWDREHMDALDPARSVVVLNKTDLGSRVEHEALAPLTVVETTLLSPAGAVPVLRALSGKLRHGIDPSVPPHAVISERHRGHLSLALAETKQAIELSRHPDEAQHILAASSLRQALESLGAVTGRTYQESLLESIFSRFCIGK